MRNQKPKRFTNARVVEKQNIKRRKMKDQKIINFEEAKLNLLYKRDKEKHIKTTTEVLEDEEFEDDILLELEDGTLFDFEIDPQNDK
tara:strand:- start:216 stop:476 length:261 start_codon:yes stop_codon:yes gene_type:complete